MICNGWLLSCYICNDLIGIFKGILSKIKVQGIEITTKFHKWFKELTDNVYIHILNIKS